MNFPLTTLDLDIARICYLGDRMMSRCAVCSPLYDRRRSERWLKDVARMKNERFTAHLRVIQGTNDKLNKKRP